MNQRLERIVYGGTGLSRDLIAWVARSGEKFVYFCGGVHGDEPEGRDLIVDLLNHFENVSLSGVIVIPEMNPDGLAARVRMNGRGVDLNRNFPTRRWGSPLTPSPGETDVTRYFAGPAAGSEPETQAFLELLEKYPPKGILSVHSWRPQVNFDGPGKEIAGILSKFNGYEVTTDIGYPTPGSLGEYTGRERQIPTITLELPEKISRNEAWKIHRPAFEEIVKRFV